MTDRPIWHRVKAGEYVLTHTPWRIVKAGAWWSVQLYAGGGIWSFAGALFPTIALAKKRVNQFRGYER